MGTHEELFALLKLASDPKAVEANLKKMEKAQKDFEQERTDAQADRAEATKQREEMRKDKDEANKSKETALAQTAKQQELKDKNEYALAENKATLDKITAVRAEQRKSEADLSLRKQQLDEREKGLEVREKEVAALKADLDSRIAKIKSAAS